MLQIDTFPTSNGRRRLAVAGEIDLSTAGQLRDAVLETVQAPGTASVDIDLAQVGFCDSSGIGALVSARNTAGGHGVTLRCTNAPDRVRRVLQLTGVLDLLTAPDADPAFPA